MMNDDNNNNSSPYQAVDLGLSVKWATFNVGANSPEDYGGYYAWGDTEEKNDYSWTTYIHCDGNHDNCHNIGTDISGSSYDVAHTKWGGSWRIPTRAEQQELIDNCTWNWTVLNGVNGMKVTGPNGNSIFLPAAGFRLGEGVYYRVSYGYYWSGSLYGVYASIVWNMSFYGDVLNPWSNGVRCYGFPVRPVSE